MKLLMENWRGHLKEGPVVSPPPGFLEGSIFKGILYHGSDHRLDKGENLDTRGAEYGIYLSPSAKYARLYGKYLYEVIVNIKNPIFVEDKSEISPKDLNQEDATKMQSAGFDGIVVSPEKTIENSSEIVIFDPSRVHVLSMR